MPTESRTYQAVFAARPVEYGGYLYQWCRVPAIQDIHSQTGVDGDWSRFRLYKLEPVEAAEDPEEVAEPTLIDSSDLVSLEEFGNLSATEPLRSEPLFSKDLDNDAGDPHPNAFTALSGQYLLFCPAPEAQLICWDLESFEEAWRIDSRKPENGTQKAFRILGVREDTGEFVVAFRERDFIETDISTVAWNPTWEEDTDELFLASYSMDTTSENVSPAGRLLLDAETGAELNRWEASEIEPELYSTITETNNFYSYLTLVDEENWQYLNSTDDDEAHFINGYPFSSWVAPLANNEAGTQFEIPRTDPETGRSWTLAGLKIVGDGIGFTASLQLGTATPDNSEEAYTWDAGRNPLADPPDPPPPADAYFIEDPPPGGYGSFVEYLRAGWETVTGGFEDSPQDWAVVKALVGYSEYGGQSGEFYLEEITPASLYQYPAGTEFEGELIDAWIDWDALAWENDALVFTTDGSDDICENFVLPGVQYFSSATRGVSAETITHPGSQDEYTFSTTDWNPQDPWYESLVDTDKASLLGRFFFESDQPETAVPGTLPQHSLVRCCITSYGIAYGPSVSIVRADLPFVWRCVNWDGSIRWTFSLDGTKSLRQSTVPVCIGSTIVTVIQEYTDDDPGPLRVVKINANDGTLLSDTALSEELHGSFDTESYDAGIYLHHEAIVDGNRLLFRAGSYLITV